MRSTVLVGAAATKSVLLALITLATATLFVDVEVQRPAMMVLLLILISIGFCLMGFFIGLLANNFEQLQFIPLLVVTPLTFLGGVFYSVSALEEPWRSVTLANPIVYLVSAYRWTFYGVSDVSLVASMTGVALTILLPLVAIAWIFKTGYKLKN